MGPCPAALAAYQCLAVCPARQGAISRTTTAAATLSLRMGVFCRRLSPTGGAAPSPRKASRSPWKRRTPPTSERGASPRAHTTRPFGSPPLLTLTLALALALVQALALASTLTLTPTLTLTLTLTLTRSAAAADRLDEQLAQAQAQLRVPSPTAGDKPEEKLAATWSASSGAEPAWLTDAAIVLSSSSPQPSSPSSPELGRRRAASEQHGGARSPRTRRGSSDRLRATELNQHPPSAISWHMSALLGAAAVVALLVTVALFSGAIRLSGSCAVPPEGMHATLTGIVERGLSQMELPPTAPSSVHHQHAGAGRPYVTTGNASVHALRVGAIEVAACYPDGRTFFDQIPQKLVIRLVAVNVTASLRYQGYAAFGDLVLELDLEHPADGKIVSCGGEFEAVPRIVTGPVQSNDDTSVVSSDIAQAICYGSSSERDSGSQPDAGGLGLTGLLNEGLRAALPELRDAVKAAVDDTLLRLLAMMVVLLAVGWACVVGSRDTAVALVRGVYAWVHQRDLRFK